MGEGLVAVPRGEDIVRYAGLTSYDPETGQVDGSAFHRKPKDVDGLSVVRRLMLSPDEAEDRALIRAAVGKRINLSAQGQFFQLNVGAMLDALAEFGQAIDVVEDALPAEGDAPANPAHALIRELPYKDMTVGSLSWLIAGDRIAKLVHDRFPARA